MAYGEEEFVKKFRGAKAPAGFHYMPNGKLMKDADHIAMFGYIDKKITGSNIDVTDIAYNGETRSFQISGQPGAVFSIEIYDDSTTPNYYNFKTRTFSTTKSSLNKNYFKSNIYDFDVVFPSIEFIDATCDYNDDPTIAHDDDDGKIKAGMTVTGTGIPAGATVNSVTSDTSFELSASTTGGAVTNGALTFGGLIKKYTINIIAETGNNIRTSHTDFEQVNFEDGSININACKGSNSNILQKIIYQDVKKNLHLSCIAPSLYLTSADTVNGAVSSSNRIVIDGSAIDPNIVQVGDLVTGTGIAASVHAIVDKIDPDGDNTNEIQTSIADSIGDGVAITFTPPFNGITPHGTDSTTGAQSIELSSGKYSSYGFTITVTAPAGRTLSAFRTPTTDDLCVFKNVTFGSSALAISGEDTDSDAKFFRWPVTNIAGLASGMTLDPARSGTGANTTTPAAISQYTTTQTSTRVVEEKYSSTIIEEELEDVSVNGIDAYGYDITAIDRTGAITARQGNITFDTQQLDALKSDSNVRIFGHGKNNINNVTGTELEIKNVVITPTQVSTTTTGSVSNSTTIPLTEIRDISRNSTVRGVGIDASAVNPIVTNKAAASGGANITVSAAQTLESGQTLFFDGASRIITITGTVVVKKMGISDTTVYFDLERFIRCA